MSLRKHLETASNKLAHIEGARLEAEILLAYTLGSPRSFLYANPELDMPFRHRRTYKKLVKRRAKGEPIAYITGCREFWSLQLRITPDVLIPRPETELLVDEALQKIPLKGHQRIADLGTGCGAIALAIASERPGCEVHATELSKAAVSLASENAGKLGISTQFHLGSWCEPLVGSFEVIVSNPPYIAKNDPHLRRGDLRFEPDQALVPGNDPLGAFRTIAEQASARLRKDGWLLLEHGKDQADGVRSILKQFGYSSVDTAQDLAGHDRVTLGTVV